MKIVLAGKFETALIRSVDEVVSPPRNVSTHEYYVGLNRKVTSSYFDRCGTFIALADATLVPSVDWNYPYGNQYRGELASVDLGIERTDSARKEWDKDTVKFVEFLLKKRVLSSSSRAYISNLTFSHYPDDVRQHMNANSKKYQKAAARHFVGFFSNLMQRGNTVHS